MLELDIRTLIVILGIVSFSAFVSLVGLWRSVPKNCGAGFWATGMGSYTIGIFFIAGRGYFADFASIILANLLILSGFLFTQRGIRVFINQRPLVLFDWLLICSVFLSFLYFTYIDPNVGNRTIIMSASMSIASAAIIFSILRTKAAPGRAARQAVAAIYLIFGVVIAVRIPVELMGELSKPMMDKLGWEILFIVSLIFVLGGSTTSLILLALTSLESERLILSSAVTQSASVIMITDKNGLLQYVNPAFVERTGYSRDEVIGQNPRFLKSGHTSPEEFSELWKKISSGEIWKGEFQNKKKNGELFWEIGSIAPVTQRDGQISNFVGVKQDCTALKIAENKVRHLANHDSLTGLPTRNLVQDRFLNAIAIAKRNQSKTAVFFIDLDGFKAVNDNFGHNVGDQVLKEVASIISSCVREVDTVARVGGDEFVIILSDVNDQEGIASVAEKVIKAIAEYPKMNSINANLGASIGIALFPEHGTSYEELIDLADLAMYNVKRTGKNKFEFYTSA